jgi:serine protease AprX
MARTRGGTTGDVRSSALWGTGSRGGDHRSRAGRGRGAGILVAALASLCLVLPLAAGADDGKRPAGPTYVAPAVYQAARNNPDGVIQVIIQSASTSQASDAVKDAEKTADDIQHDATEATKTEQQAAAAETHAVEDAQKAVAESDAAAAKARRADKKAKAAAEREAEKAAAKAERLLARAAEAQQAHTAAADTARRRNADASRIGRRKLTKLADKLKLIGAVSVEIPAGWVELLGRTPGLVVTLDAPVKASALSATQLWPYQDGSSSYWGSTLNPGPKAPAIAIVDSGIARGVVGFGVNGSRIVKREVITSLPQSTATQDGRGHGTVVAGLAAGDAPGYAGVAPRADLVDLDVMDDQGMARTSDVIKAAQWILDHKDEYNIRVANFSLHSSSVLSIRYHPLNAAVEKLWLNGVVVVAAAGNYGTAAGPSGVVHAPGNDPFVITVGAYDLQGSAQLRDHDVPDWSAYGYTNEGFAKPDVVAAGRFLVAPGPAGATLGLEKAGRLLAGNYLKLSGTSFSAPIVSGMAAQILARKPGWTPDQVKGALMMSGRRIPGASLLQQGRGEVNLVRALGVGRPVNPNAGIDRFLRSDDGDTDGDGYTGRAFDSTSFYAAVKASRTWDSAAWQDAAWQDAAWQDAAWQDAAWQDAAWQDAAWQDAAWSDSTSYADNADGDDAGAASLLTPAEQAALAADPELNPAGTP